MYPNQVVVSNNMHMKFYNTVLFCKQKHATRFLKSSNTKWKTMAKIKIVMQLFIPSSHNKQSESHLTLQYACRKFFQNRSL